MPLQHLVEYFNDRLGREHPASISVLYSWKKAKWSFRPNSNQQLFCAAKIDVKA